MFSLICVWINGWVNNREAGDLRRNRGHYGVIVMIFFLIPRVTAWQYPVPLSIFYLILSISYAFRKRGSPFHGPNSFDSCLIRRFVEQSRVSGSEKSMVKYVVLGGWIGSINSTGDIRTVQNSPASQLIINQCDLFASLDITNVLTHSCPVTHTNIDGLVTLFQTMACGLFGVKALIERMVFLLSIGPILTNFSETVL